MLGGEYHVGRAHERVGTSGVDFECFVESVEDEAGGCSGRFTDPLGLHLLGGCWPVDFFEIFEQSVGIGSDLEDPLSEIASNYGEGSAFGFAVDDFFVGQYCAKFFTPPNGAFVDVG